MERLAGLDGAFLSLESPTNPPPHSRRVDLRPDLPSDGGVGFRRIRDLVADRLPLVPPFRKRMVEVPFGLQHPSMVDDPAFDIDYHVRRVKPSSAGRTGRAGEPGGRPGLATARPAPAPVGFHVVEGLEGGHIALVPKVHHAIIDGVSGA